MSDKVFPPSPTEGNQLGSAESSDSEEHIMPTQQQAVAFSSTTMVQQPRNDMMGVGVNYLAGFPGFPYQMPMMCGWPMPMSAQQVPMTSAVGTENRSNTQQTPARVPAPQQASTSPLGPPAQANSTGTLTELTGPAPQASTASLSQGAEANVHDVHNVLEDPQRVRVKVTRCSICQERKAPLYMLLKCGHVEFCNDCLVDHNGTTPVPSCPVCTQEVEKKIIVKRLEKD